MTGSRQNTMRIQPSLPSIFLHGFARQCRTRAASCTGALFTTLLSQYDFNCQPPRRRQTALERHPHIHVRGTELLLGVCALCFGLALDCASGSRPASAIASATLSEPGTRYVLNTVAVSSLSSAALTRDRVASTSTRRRSDVSVVSPSATACLTARRPALAEPPPACACPKKASRSPSFLKMSRKCSAMMISRFG